MGKREAAGNLDFGSAETKERERALEPAIPKGLCPPAQGCEPRATLGEPRHGVPTPSVVPFGGTTTCATIRQMAQLQIVTFGTFFDAKWHYRWGWSTPPAFPRVARGSQPCWALRRNPFGIQRGSGLIPQDERYVWD